MRNIGGKEKGFQVKLKHWEDGQRLKLEQVRWIENLLVLTKTTYLAIASEDKVPPPHRSTFYCPFLQFFGTGWRKNRDEANKPIFWDGKNEGGKVMMHIRHELKSKHSWTGPQEEEVQQMHFCRLNTQHHFQESNTKLREMMRNVWRRIDPSKRAMFGGGRSAGVLSHGGGARGGRGGGNLAEK